MPSSRSGAGPRRESRFFLVEREAFRSRSLPAGTRLVVEGNELEEIITAAADMAGVDLEPVDRPVRADGGGDDGSP